MSYTTSRNTQKFAIFDWDGVLRPGFLLVDWAEHLDNLSEFESGKLSLMKNYLRAYHAQELPYSDIASIIPEIYAQGLRGFSVDRHLGIAADYAASSEFRSSLTPLAAQLLNFIQTAEQLHAVIISGGPASILDSFGASTGFFEVWAVKVAVANNVFTGEILDNPAVKDRKQELIERYFPPERILLAAGDSESDQPMLVAATYRITVGAALADKWQGEPNALVLPPGDLGERTAGRIETFLRNMEHP